MSILKEGKIDKSWTLFLDRDGVINKHLPDTYVLSWGDFEFIEGSIEAISHLSKIFGRVIVVTNQQGVGKGLMSTTEVEELHFKMIDEIKIQGGKIDAVYYCPHLKEFQPLCRKPNTGMALEAKEDFPEIDFTKSIMVGDSDTDIEMGNRLNMYTVKISNSYGNKTSEKITINEEFESLWAWTIDSKRYNV